MELVGLLNISNQSSHVWSIISGFCRCWSIKQSQNKESFTIFTKTAHFPLCYDTLWSESEQFDGSNERIQLFYPANDGIAFQSVASIKYCHLMDHLRQMFRIDGWKKMRGFLSYFCWQIIWFDWFDGSILWIVWYSRESSSWSIKTHRGKFFSVFPTHWSIKSQKRRLTDQK